MKKNILFLFSVLMSSVGLTDIYYWNGGVGDWSDPQNWRVNEKVPDSCPCSASDVARFYAGGTVNVDGDYKIQQILVQAQSTQDPIWNVRLTGAGTVEGTLQVGNNRYVVIDGATVRSSGAAYVQNYATLELVNRGTLEAGSAIYLPNWKKAGASATIIVDGGRLVSIPGSNGFISSFDDGSRVVLRAGEIALDALTFSSCAAILEVSGGKASFNTITVSTTSKILQTGGELVWKSGTVDPATDIEVTAGKFTYGGASSLSRVATSGFLEAESNRYEATGRSSVDAVTFNTGSQNEVVLNGELIVTNASAATGVTFTNDTNKLILSGAGKLVAKKVRLTANISSATITLPELVIGSSFSSEYLKNNVGIELHFPRPITLGSLGDWQNESANSKIYFENDYTVDTADWSNHTTPRTVQLFKMWNKTLIGLTVAGTGVYKPFYNSAGVGAILRRVDVKDSATFSPHCGNPTDWVLPGLRCEAIRFDPNAKLTIGTYPPNFTFETDFETLPAALTVCAPPASVAAAGRAYPAITPHTPGMALADGLFDCATVQGGSPDWVLKNLNGTMAFVPSAGVAETTTTGTHWTGAKDGTLTDDANWSAGAPASGLDAALAFDGIRNTVVTNVLADGYTAKQLYFTEAAGPFTLRGTPIRLANTASTINVNAGTYDCAVAAVRGNYFPVVLETEVVVPEAQYNLTVANAGYSYVAFMGDVDAKSSKFTIFGDVRVGGNFICNKFAYLTNTANPDRPTMLTVMDGATFTVKTAEQWGNQVAFIKVDKGGTMTVEAGTYGVSSATAMPYAHVVDGLLDVKVALSSWSTTAHKYTGSGRFNFKGISCGRSGTYKQEWIVPLNLGGTLKVYNTGAVASAWGEGNPIVVTDSPTLGAKTDWTYPAGADRQITLADKYATLIVDTQDPDNATAHNVTIAAPITGAGSLVKDGTGSLTLSSSANAIGGGVHIKAGTFSYAEPFDFASLTVDAGATLEIPSETLSASGDISINGAKLNFPASTKEALWSGWTTLISVPQGFSISGTPDLGISNVRLRTIEKDGLVQMQGRIPPGMLLMVR